MLNNGIFESMIKLYSTNFAPEGAKLSVKIVHKGHTSTKPHYTNLLS